MRITSAPGGCRGRSPWGERRKAGLNTRHGIIRGERFYAPLAPRFPVEIHSMTQTAAQTQDATQDLDEEAIAAALERMKLLPPGQKARCQPLPGGVSSDIWLVGAPGRRLCLKRGRPGVKGGQGWEAP